MRGMMVLAAAAAMVAAAPAVAQRYLINVNGFVAVAPSGNPIPELVALQGQPITAAFEVDSRQAIFTQGAPAGGTGATGLWGGSVQQGVVQLGFSNTLLRNGNDLGNIFLVDNSTTSPSVRLDQATISASARFVSGALVRPYDILGALPGDIFLQSLAFGRTQSGTATLLPTFVTDVTQRPDFASYLNATGASLPFLSLNFRRGSPTAANQLSALPFTQIGVAGLSFTVTNLSSGAVPEPASWAMLIAGFGLVGAVMRRRRLAAA